MVHVIATIELKPGQREAFLAEFRKLVPQVRAERGCLQYEPAIDVASGLPVQTPLRGDAVVVVEKWADIAALTAHMEAPHLVAFRERVAEMLAGLTLQVLQPA
jgi:quinol monooxygenase YgiN